jgi:hypothetical protein
MNPDLISLMFTKVLGVNCCSLGFFTDLRDAGIFEEALF